MSLAEEFVARVGPPDPRLVSFDYAPTAEVIGTSVLVSWPLAQLTTAPPKRRWFVLNEALLEQLRSAEVAEYWVLMARIWREGFDSRAEALASLGASP